MKTAAGGAAWPRWAGAAGALAASLLLVACGSAPKPAGSPVVDLAGRCSQVEEDGYREDARLDIRDGSVEELIWHAQVGKRGSCSFHLGNFRQVQSRPHIELLARDASGCKLVIYGDSRRITLGHAGCERQCTPGIVDDTWPVMFDPKTGACAPLGR